MCKRTMVAVGDTFLDIIKQLMDSGKLGPIGLYVLTLGNNYKWFQFG